MGKGVEGSKPGGLRRSSGLILSYVFLQTFLTGAPLYGWISAMQKLKLAPLGSNLGASGESEPGSWVVYTFLLFEVSMRSSQILSFPLCFLSDVVGPRTGAVLAEAFLAAGIKQALLSVVGIKKHC